MSEEIHIVKALAEKTRISDYAIDKFKILPTKSGIKKALKKGEISINGKQAYSGDWLVGGEELKLIKEDLFRPYNLELDVIYEDDHLAVIKKPAGIPVHSHAHRNIQNALTGNLKKSPLEDALVLPRPVHRLDHETCGLLIIAKSYKSMTKLNLNMASRQIKKTYTAAVIGDLVAESPITDLVNGKQSHTEFEIIQTIDSEKYGKLNLVRILLHTGRRNQIRVHFHSLGNPILGDKKFFVENKVSYGNGLYLIANRLEFEHPVHSEPIKIELPLPKKFTRLFPGVMH